MSRLAMGIEYSGKNYHGWQVQPGLTTLQAALQAAIAKFVDEPVNVVCAGRTDTGVHALEQVVHFDTDVDRSLKSWIFGVNSYLPHDMSVRWAKVINDDFHARFSALSRQYVYYIYNSPVRRALYYGHQSWHHRHLDEGMMAEAIQSLKGEHDFSSFRASMCQAKSPVRTIMDCGVERQDTVIRIHITANAFLHHMVRNIVGVLLAIGNSKYDVDWCGEVLRSKNRALGGITAPPHGLYLSKIMYPEKYQLPKNKTHLPFSAEFSPLD